MTGDCHVQFGERLVGKFHRSTHLDFVGGHEFATSQLTEMKSCIESYIAGRYGFEVTVKEPSEMAKEPEYKDIKVDKWQIAITTSPARKDIPKQKIKIEVCNVPAYTRQPIALKANYDFLPDGYGDILIMTEDQDEILADKLISLVNTTKYTRHRDIWDLRWLRQRGSKINLELVQSKINDYQISDYHEKLMQKINSIAEIISGSEFHNELSRFIPIDAQARTLSKDKFKAFLVNETTSLLTELRQFFENKTPPGEFDI